MQACLFAPAQHTLHLHRYDFLCFSFCVCSCFASQAILGGAIPVIIGPPQLARLQFQYEGDPPPFVFAASAEDALSICQQLVLASSSSSSSFPVVPVPVPVPSSPLSPSHSPPRDRARDWDLESGSGGGGVEGLSSPECCVGAGAGAGAGDTVIDELRKDIAEWYIRVYQNINNRVGYTLGLG
jgi:hypothetical protein